MPKALSRRWPLDLVRALAVALAVLALPAVLRADTAAPAFQPKLGPAEAFSFDTLTARAEALAKQPYAPHIVQHPELYDKIDYDAYWHIRVKPEDTVFAGSVPVQFFHEGTYFRNPVGMHLVENGQSREVLYSSDYFDMPKDSPAQAVQSEAGFAGFRLMWPGKPSDWLAYLGAALAVAGLFGAGTASAADIPAPDNTTAAA